jgi:hypothetical protein
MTADGPEFHVDVSSIVRPVTRVGSGTLYGLSDEGTPPVRMMMPLKLVRLRQPPPFHEHRPNGLGRPVGDTLRIAANARAIGAAVTIDMADTFDGFPYWWTAWPDWLDRIDRMIAAVRDLPEITKMYAWEPWNEPDCTWPAAAGGFLDGWVRTVRRIRRRDPDAPVVGPSHSRWDLTAMDSFLRHARATGTVPDVVSWHELDGWRPVAGNVRAYRALERRLGIPPRPISINEYAARDEIDVPAAVNRYIAQFEREGVHDAQRAFWYEAGTLNGLLHDNRPTASYWLYRWYADQAGDIVATHPAGDIDGVAAHDGDSGSVSVVVGGPSGTHRVRVTGLARGTVRLSVDRVAGTGRTTIVARPTNLLSAKRVVTDGTLAVSVDNADPGGAYRLRITPQALPPRTTSVGTRTP